MTDVEIIVVGGGPAGSACAGELVRSGREVLILDKNTFPRLKPCAGWVTPKVFRDLHTTPASYPYKIRHVQTMVFYIYGKKIPLKTRQFGIRRIEFDDWLLKNSGSPIQRHPVQTIRLEEEHYIIDNTYRCKYLVGAGGTHCPVYTSLFSNSNPRKQTNHIITIEEEFPYEYQDDRCILWMMENGLPGYSWYFPKGDGYLNVGIGAKYESLKRRNESIHFHWDLLIKKLDKLKLVNSYQYKPRGYSYYIRHRAINVHYGNSFIVGDAAGLATRDMGEGIGPAIRSGILAAKSIVNNIPYTLRTVNSYSLPGLIFPGRKF